MTANLLEMSRLETGGGGTWRELLSMSEILAVAIQHARGRAEGRSISNTTQGPDLLVMANPALFELVLANVLDNAIRYSDDGTRITVDCRKKDDWCVLEIADEGYGIPDDDLERVFDRFYRVDRAEASPRGSGLGLAIAKGFVEALDGEIEARIPGMDGVGTKLVIRIPLEREVA